MTWLGWLVIAFVVFVLLALCSDSATWDCPKHAPRDDDD